MHEKTIYDGLYHIHMSYILMICKLVLCPVQQTNWWFQNWPPEISVMLTILIGSFLSSSPSGSCSQPALYEVTSRSSSFLLFHRPALIQGTWYHTSQHICQVRFRKSVMITQCVNSLAPGRWDCDLKLIIFKLISMIVILSLSCEIALRWMPHNLTDN